jgi:hypothetical protein
MYCCSAVLLICWVTVMSAADADGVCVCVCVCVCVYVYVCETVTNRGQIYDVVHHTRPKKAHPETDQGQTPEEDPR